MTTPTPAATDDLATDLAAASRASGFDGLLISGLYVTQALGVGFLGTGLAIILRQAGVGLEVLGLITLAGLAWPLKFLWAPLTDRFGAKRGHYRSWLLVLQPLMVLTILAMLPFGDLTDLTGVVVLGVALAVLSATQDTASDALAVGLMRGKRRGIVNGLQVAGGYLGNLLGGGVTVLIYSAWGWQAAIGFLAVATALPIITILLAKEPPLPRERPTVAASFASLLTVLRQPGATLWAVGAVTAGVASVSMLTGLTSPALVDRGWDDWQVALLTGIGVGIAGIVGGLGGGALVRWRGRRIAFATTSLATVALAAAAVVVVFGGLDAVLVWVVVCGTYVAFTALSAVHYTVAMDYSREGSAGSDFTLQNSISQAASFIAASGALFLAAWLGYTVAGWIAVAGLIAATLLGMRHLAAHGQRFDAAA